MSQQRELEQTEDNFLDFDNSIALPDGGYNSIVIRQQAMAEHRRPEPKIHRDDVLRFRLQGNPYFPQDELDFVPSLASIAPDLARRLYVAITRSPSHTEAELNSAAFKLVEWSLIQEIETDAEFVDHENFEVPDLRSLERVTVRNWHGGSSAPYYSTTCPRFLNALFSNSPNAHTLTLKRTDIDSATSLVSANLPYLRRLVLHLSEDVGRTRNKKDFCSHAFFEAIAANPILESVILLNPILLSGDTLALLQEKKPPVKFGSTVDTSQPPPSVAALRTDIPRSLPEVSDPKEVCKLRLGADTVPLHNSLIHRCLLLESMLESVPAEKRREITLSMEPPVSKAALTLAMVFVTHFVTSDIHEECKKYEGQATGSRCSWNPRFEIFWQHCIRADFTAKKQFLILCELMSVATYLNIPALKRFIRVALSFSLLESSSTTDDGW